MIFYQKNDSGFEIFTPSEQLKQKIFEETKDYRVVKSETREWENLDDDRSDETTTEKRYPVLDGGYSYGFSIIVKDGHFYGLHVFFCESSNREILTKTSALAGYIIYINGTTIGTPCTISSYDTPNTSGRTYVSYHLEKANQTI
jgi:hypothetical protein